MNNSPYNLLVLTGATATGKTTLAVHLAHQLDGEIISADSRQVYRGMDIGTGKDISEYTLDGQEIPHHLIDIVDAGEQYNVFQFQQDFIQTFDKITKSDKFPILCGGTGMYIESIAKGYKMHNVPTNQQLRTQLATHTTDQLVELLNSYKALHNTTDTQDHERLLRAIEVAKYQEEHQNDQTDFPELSTLFVGIKYDRDTRRNRISIRLKERLENGMIQEVQSLLDQGASPERLILYGLEYKFITQYLLKELDYNQMFTLLEIAIHQFSKRQLTWFRRMEKKGTKIHWLDGQLPLEEKIYKTKQLLTQCQLSNL